MEAQLTEVEPKRWASVVQELCMLREELEHIVPMVKDKTSSIKSKLLSLSKELQQDRENSSKLDQTVPDHGAHLLKLEGHAGMAQQYLEGAENQVDMIKMELKDVECVLRNQQDEMGYLHELPTLKHLSQDQEGRVTLEHQNMLQTTCQQLEEEKMELKKLFKGVANENEEIKKAFKKLLEDKSSVCFRCSEKILKKQIPFATRIFNVDDTLQDGKTKSLDILNPPPTSSSRNTNHMKCSSACSTTSSDPFIPMGATLQDFSMSSNSANIKKDIDLNGNSLQAKYLLQNQHSKCEENVDSIPSDKVIAIAAASHPLPVPDELQRSLSLTSLSSVEYYDDPALEHREDERKKNRELQIVLLGDDLRARISLVPGETLDEDYYLIDTDSIPPSNESNKVTSFPMGLTNLTTPELGVLEHGALAPMQCLVGSRYFAIAERVGGRDEAGSRPLMFRSVGLDCGDVNEVMLEGGEMHQVEVLVKECGMRVTWNFRTEPKGIAFGISYREEMVAGDEVEVLPLKRCVSHKTVFTGEYCAQKKGVYILKFDNCHSMYSGRKLLFKVSTKFRN